MLFLFHYAVGASVPAVCAGDTGFIPPSPSNNPHLPLPPQVWTALLVTLATFVLASVLSHVWEQRQHRPACEAHGQGTTPAAAAEPAPERSGRRRAVHSSRQPAQPAQPQQPPPPPPPPPTTQQQQQQQPQERLGGQAAPPQGGQAAPQGGPAAGGKHLRFPTVEDSEGAAGTDSPAAPQQGQQAAAQPLALHGIPPPAGAHVRFASDADEAFGAARAATSRAQAAGHAAAAASSRSGSDDSEAAGSEASPSRGGATPGGGGGGGTPGSDESSSAGSGSPSSADSTPPAHHRRAAFGFGVAEGEGVEGVGGAGGTDIQQTPAAGVIIGVGGLCLNGAAARGWRLL